MTQRVYTVTWKVEVDATSPEAAAELARLVLDDDTRAEDIFEVEAIEDEAGEPCPAVIIVRNGVGERRFK
jgi:hypothetical protein